MFVFSSLENIRSIREISLKFSLKSQAMHEI